MSDVISQCKAEALREKARAHQSAADRAREKAERLDPTPVPPEPLPVALPSPVVEVLPVLFDEAAQLPEIELEEEDLAEAEEELPKF